MSVELLTPNVRLFFRDQLREARGAAFSDAEGYQQLLFAIERLGSFLFGKVHSLGTYKPSIQQLAVHSILAVEIPNIYRDWHIPFNDLYAYVKDARNDALHQGAYARNLTNHAFQLALILEDALMTDQRTICDFMVRDPIIAYDWQPVSFVRQQMLANSFSYIPINIASEDKKPDWRWISECELAIYLREDHLDRKNRLAKRVSDVIKDQRIANETAAIFNADISIDKVFPILEGNKPILIVENVNLKHLVGILTAFDIL